jgi:hypothetical protein
MVWLPICTFISLVVFWLHYIICKSRAIRLKDADKILVGVDAVVDIVVELRFKLLGSIEVAQRITAFVAEFHTKFLRHILGKLNGGNASEFVQLVGSDIVIHCVNVDKIDIHILWSFGYTTIIGNNRAKLPMFHIYALAATRASDVVKIEKVRFLDCDIGFFIFKNRVAAGANDFPHLFPVIVFYNFHTSCCFGYTLIYAKGVPNWFQAGS